MLGIARTLLNGGLGLILLGLPRALCVSSGCGEPDQHRFLSFRMSYVAGVRAVCLPRYAFTRPSSKVAEAEGTWGFWDSRGVGKCRQYRSVLSAVNARAIGGSRTCCDGPTPSSAPPAPALPSVSPSPALTVIGESRSKSIGEESDLRFSVVDGEELGIELEGSGEGVGIGSSS